MSSISDIRDAWAVVWADQDIKDFTSKVYDYEVTTNSEAEKALISDDAKINFVEVVTTKSVINRELGGYGSGLCEFKVEVRYTIEKLKPGDELDGEAHTAAVDFLEALYSVVENTLGVSWQNTVDYWDHDGPPQISSETIGEVECWRVVQRFNGFQYTTI